MHRFVASAAVVLFLSVCVPAGHGGTYTFTFDSFAGSDGEVLNMTSFDVGPFTAYIYDSKVIGSSSPDYAGHVGLLPQSQYVSLHIVYGGGVQFNVGSVTATFAGATSDVIHWYASTGDGTPYWYWQDTASGVTTESYALPPAPDNVFEFFDLSSVDSSGTQLLSVTINTADAVPEPSSAVLAAVGLVGLVAASRRTSGQL